MKYTLLSLSLSTLFAACIESTSSSNVRTAGIAALIDVTATDIDHSDVRVVLKVGGAGLGSYVDLDFGDRLLATVGGEERDLQAEGTGRYETQLAEGLEDALFVVSLEREEDVSAPGNSGTLPPPFAFTSEFGATPVSRASEDIVVTWEPSQSTDRMEIEVEEIGCFSSYSEEIGGDPGMWTIPAGALRTVDSDDPETCNATVRLTRTRNGQTDRAFDPDSRFRLHQTRTTQFVSAP